MKSEPGTFGRTLADIWTQSLGVEEIGDHDHFLDLGGNSITAMMICRRAQEVGIRLTPRLLFTHPTLAELTEALRAGNASERPTMFPSPEQYALLRAREEKRPRAPRMAVLRTAPGLRPDVIRTALRSLLSRHPSLRQRLVREDGRWTRVALSVPPGSASVLRVVDTVAGEAPAEPGETVAELTGRINPDRGDLICATFVDAGPGGPGTLTVAVDPLGADLVSWPALLQDLVHAAELAQRDEPGLPPAAGDSFDRWAELLTEWANGDEAAGRMEHWQRLPVSPPPLPVAVNVSGPPVGPRTLTAFAPALTMDAARMTAVLAAAFAPPAQEAVAARVFAAELDADGREKCPPDLDFSTAVGPFTAVFPFTVALAHDADVHQDLEDVFTALRAVSDGGADFGALRHLSFDAGTRGRLAALPRPTLRLHWAPQPDAPVSDVLAADGPFEFRDAPPEPDRPDALVAVARPDAGRVRVDLSYDPRGVREEAVRELLDRAVGRIGELAEAVPGDGAGRPSAERFALSGLAQDDLDALLSGMLSGTDEEADR
ncbi:phosphopantetheine-binding protein [Streptomyces sp. NPDC050610]|uniref:phosphopantetheine-binding protein n=1 Tax=Streptomyces sp. NPDC050610 TaxID=3157097 RepID=UPI00343CF13B